MAVPNEWNLITFKALTDPGWIVPATGTLPDLPGEVLELIIAGTPLLLYTVKAGDPRLFSGLGLRPFLAPDDAIASAVVQTQADTQLGAGTQWTSVRRGDGAWLFYDTSTGNVEIMTGADLATLAVFIS